MNNEQGNEPVSEIFDNYNETQREILAIETRKTKNKLIIIAVVIFLFDFIAISVLNLLTVSAIGSILIIPVIMGLLALLANKEPLLSMILATLVLFGIWIYTIAVLGVGAAKIGLLSKIVLITLLLTGFQNAREAQRIKRELKI
jgi:hypothetical protein